MAVKGGGADDRRRDGGRGGLMHVNVKQRNEVLHRSSKPFSLSEKGEKTVAFCPACSVCSSCNFPGQSSSFDGNKTRMNRSETST